jgi:DNA-binding transcriptional regulator YhcF (GntR family)
MYRIDQRSTVPVYEQLVRQIERSILSGEIEDGDKLPSIRELASSLRINPNTVAKSYNQLENRGLVISKRGLGIFASTSGLDLAHSRRRYLEELTDDYLGKARALGLEDGEILAFLSRRLEEGGDRK